MNWGIQFSQMIGKGYDRLIIVDSIKSEKARPEQFYKLKLEELTATMHLRSSHGMGLATRVELASKWVVNSQEMSRFML
ncbi:hypothetical protein DRP98_05515 [candidate division KSB1 bacterium]|nr:MAG: hypothetical protein DRP98_05515 [candidate division KSB1 bacterium]